MGTRMLGKAGTRRLLVPSRGRCTCRDCAIEPTKGQQRRREERAWRRESGT